MNEIEEMKKQIAALTKRVALLEGKTKGDRPTLEELKVYFKEKGQPQEAEKFFDFYESKGWKVGKNPMKKWKSAANNWMRRSNERGFEQNTNKIKPEEGKYSNVLSVQGDNRSHSED